MTHEELNKQFQIASEVVATWPLWKQNLLEDMSKPTVRTPREPVNNSEMSRKGKSQQMNQSFKNDPSWLNNQILSICKQIEEYDINTKLPSLSETIASIRDTKTANFCNLIDELAQAKDVGGSNFNDAREMLVQLLEFHTEIRTLDYVLAEIEYACGEAKALTSQ